MKRTSSQWSKFSVKSPRVVMQHIGVTLKLKSITGMKLALYLCVFSAVYFYARFYLFLPTVTHQDDKMIKPLETFSSSNASVVSLEIWRQFQDFQHDWYRQRRARVDWQAMIKPCSGNTAWGLVKNHWGRVNRTSGRESEIVHMDIRPAGEFSKIFIQSKTADKRTKRIGGDTWNVYVRGPSNVAATVFDHQDGTYEALFLLAEPGIYDVIINLEYSLCDGFKDPPRDWFIKGNVQGKYQKDGLLGPLDHYLKEPFTNGNPLTVYVPEAQINTSFVELLPDYVAGSCSATCSRLWDGFGRWTNNKWRPYLEESHNVSVTFEYSRNGTLWIYGDSLGLRLTRSVRSRPLCQMLYTQCRNSYTWIYPVRNKWKSIHEDDDFMPERVIGQVLAVLQNPLMQGEENVLLLNLGLHFTQAVNFTTYQRLIGDLIVRLKDTELDSQGQTVPKYKAKIIWKTTTFMHKEKASRRNETRFRFFTPQRVALFSAYAMSAMCQAGYDVVDVYPMTASFPGGTIDYVHYRNHVFSAMETLLEAYKANNNKVLGRNEKRNNITRCIG